MGKHHFMVSCVCVLTFLPCFCNVSAQSFHLTWEKTISDTLNPEDVKNTSDGGYILTGTSNSPFNLIKTDPDGNVVWRRNYVKEYSVWFSNVFPDGDGGYTAVCNYTKDWISFYCSILTFDSSGNEVGENTCSQPVQCFGAFCMRNSTGHFVVVGHVYADSNTCLNFLEIDSTGRCLASKRYNLGVADFGEMFAPSKDGGYLIMGSTSEGPSHYSNPIIIKINSQGDSIWSRIFWGARISMGESVVPLDDGGYLLAGRLISSDSMGTDHDRWIIRLDSLGDTLWTRVLRKPGNNFAKDIIVFPGGNYAVMGYGYYPGSPSDSGASPFMGVLSAFMDSQGKLLSDHFFGSKTSGRVFYSSELSGDSSLVFFAKSGSAPAGLLGKLVLVNSGLASDIIIHPRAISANRCLSPNPFNGDVVIRPPLGFGHSSIRIFNALGRQILFLNTIRGEKVVWKAAHERCGVYFIRISDEKTIVTEKAVLLR